MNKIGIGIGATLVIAVALLLFIGNLNNAESANEDVGLSQEEVEEGLDLQENGANGTYVVNLLSGSFEGEVEGIVRTDTDCEADVEGISRCKSEIELDVQKKLMVSSPHNMDNNRCFSPGETVDLSRNEDGNVIVELTEM